MYGRYWNGHTLLSKPRTQQEESGCYTSIGHGAVQTRVCRQYGTRKKIVSLVSDGATDVDRLSDARSTILLQERLLIQMFNIVTLGSGSTSRTLIPWPIYQN